MRCQNESYTPIALFILGCGQACPKPPPDILMPLVNAAKISEIKYEIKRSNHTRHDQRMLRCSKRKFDLLAKSPRNYMILLLKKGDGCHG